MKNRRKHSFAVVYKMAPGAALLAIGLSTREARAATIQVNTTVMNDVNDNSCGLTEAVVAVNTHHSYHGCLRQGTGSDVILVPGGTYTAVDSFMLHIQKSATILGQGTLSPSTGPATIIYAGGLTSSNSQLFLLDDSLGQISVTLKNLTLLGGNNPNVITGVYAPGSNNSTLSVQGVTIQAFTFGGIFADGFSLNVQNSLFFQNVAVDSGGAIFASTLTSNLTISQSSFILNDAPNYGGAIEYLGTGQSNLISSTLNQNNANFGGGIDIYAANGTFAISGCTIDNNTCMGGANCGGGVETSNLGSGSGTNYTMDASIVADNLGSAVFDDWSSDGHIVVSNSMILANQGILFVDGGNNLNGVDPVLNTDYFSMGGVYPVPVNQLDPSSPAIDYLSSFSQKTDQRGFPRGISRDGKRHSKQFDIGAFEYDPNTQAETLVAVASSPSSGPVIVSGTGYSNGFGAELPATKAGDFVTYYIPIAADGARHNFAEFATGPKEGIVQLEWSINPTFPAGSTVAIGAPVDLYSANSGFRLVDYKNQLDMGPDDPNYFRFRVTGKNSKSTGYAVFIDYVNSILGP